MICVSAVGVESASLASSRPISPPSYSSPTLGNPDGCCYISSSFFLSFFRGGRSRAQVFELNLFSVTRNVLLGNKAERSAVATAGGSTPMKPPPERQRAIQGSWELALAVSSFFIPVHFVTCFGVSFCFGYWFCYDYFARDR